MKKIPKLTISLLVSLLMGTAFLCAAFADHDDYRKRKSHEKRERRHYKFDDNKNQKITNNPTYTENCGACHFVYQPGLLPSGSWDKIINSLADHFGEPLELEIKSKNIITEYLKSNAAEFSSTELSAKIMKSIGNQIPLRITEIPYIKKKHTEIKKNILERTSIGSLSNCSACHSAAERGIYDDDNIVIPR